MERLFYDGTIQKITKNQHTKYQLLNIPLYNIKIFEYKFRYAHSNKCIDNKGKQLLVPMKFQYGIETIYRNLLMQFPYISPLLWLTVHFTY